MKNKKKVIETYEKMLHDSYIIFTSVEHFVFWWNLKNIYCWLLEHKMK